MTGAQRRQNLLTGDWVLVSPQRVTRPWHGAVELSAAPMGAAHDPDCYLCPGNGRSGGQRNPAYVGPWVFDNDFPALGVASGAPVDDPLFVGAPAGGACRVICYHPDHRLTMAAMSDAAIGAVIEVWAAQTAELRTHADMAAVTIFENRGAMMGASNPHPHGQLWATGYVPNELAREDLRQRDWQAAHGTVLLDAYRRHEQAAGERVVLTNADWVAVVPWWAAWPFETLLLPVRQVESIDALDIAARTGLAALLGQLLRAYDRLFDTPCPYTFGWHQAPFAGPAPHFMLHGHIYPPLLRSASVRKHMVGFEMLAMPQRDLTPEDAATRLRGCL
jgi:UDPglucose--hexose-1-phosphate uridylyltransferase